MSADQYSEAEKKQLKDFLDEREERTLFQGLIFGLMCGIVVLHAIQPIAALVGTIPWTPKTWVAVAGAVLYTVCAVGLYIGKRWGMVIAIGGPIVGFTTLVVGWIFGATVRPDVWTWGGAVLQIPAQLVAVMLLRPPQHKYP
jgi:hypothetical protein